MDNIISQDFFNVSLKCLTIPTLRVVSTLLNPIKYIPTKENLPRDWKGLADLTGCNREDVSSFECTPDPTLAVLRRWSEKEGSTVQMFLLFLEKLDRYDVFDDIIPFITTDINNHRSNARHYVDTSMFITLKDRERNQQGLPPKQFDASILYADEDSEFAVDTITILEQQYRLDIFVKERDLTGGTIEPEAIMRVIADRSNRLIIILSPAFLESPENKYFMSFAQSIGIETRRRKIIPCIYKECDVPYELRHLHKLDYGRSGILYNFYEKLYTSIIPGVAIGTRTENTLATISTPSVIKDTLTIPQTLPSTLKEHNSLPELTTVSDTLSSERNVDSISESSLPMEKTSSGKKFNLSKIFTKKVFKKKQGLVEAS